MLASFALPIPTIFFTLAMRRISARHKLYKETDPHAGDAYTFVGIERNTKLILAWHLGERRIVNTEAFTEKPLGIQFNQVPGARLLDAK